MSAKSKYFPLITLLLGSMLVLAGCSGSGPSAKAVGLEEASVRETILVADPELAVEEIYGALDEVKTQQLNGRELEEIVGISAGSLDEYFAYQSDPRSGLADVIIVKVSGADERDEVRKLLYQYKDRRISEFENYNILDSYEIAQDAVVYDQGDYTLMLMLPDNETAQDIVDLYFPQ